MPIPNDAPAEVKAVFYETLLQIMLNLDFERIATSVQASKFGWARPMVERNMPYADILWRAKSIAMEVANAAMSLALEDNTEHFVGSGGFEVTVRPTGQVVEMKFVLDSYDTYTDDEREDEAEGLVTTEET